MDVNGGYDPTCSWCTLVPHLVQSMLICGAWGYGPKHDLRNWREEGEVIMSLTCSMVSLSLSPDISSFYLSTYLSNLSHRPINLSIYPSIIIYPSIDSIRYQQLPQKSTMVQIPALGCDHFVRDALAVRANMAVSWLMKPEMSV